MLTMRNSLALANALVAVLCLIPASPSLAADWLMQGADAGMTKYSPGNIPAAAMELQYQKRFYTDWRSYTGNYYYGSTVLVRNGQAFVFCNDLNDPSRTASTRGVRATLFNWQTGGAITHYSSPFYWEAHAAEIDSHHFTNPLVWHSDGRIYGRRGGDRTANYALNLTTSVWTAVPLISPPDGHSWGGDANAFLRTYGNYLLYRYGDTRDPEPYAAYDISPAAWTGNRQGAYFMSIGPVAVSTYWYYGDFPKAAQNVVVIACCNSPGVTLYASNLSTAGKWTRSFTSDYGGAGGFYTSISDYWRFIASEEGYYVFFTRDPAYQTPPTLRALNIATGQDVWSYSMTDMNERPLLACHNGSLYVVGRSQQLKMSLSTGAVIWQQHNSFPNDTGYIHANYYYGTYYTSDPLYRPMVLTDDTLWFVDGQSRGSGTLVGLRTADGTIVQQINLAALYSGTEHLDYVNDLITADGKVGLLVSVSDDNDPNHAVAFYQDLYLYANQGITKVISASAGTGGTIQPSGDVVVDKNGSQTFTITPTADCDIADVKVDGVSVGKVSTYTFSDVTTNHTISVTFEGHALVGWWKMDETAGTTASDSSGHGNNATILNGAQWTAGKIGGGLSLNGTNQYVLTTQNMTSLFPDNSVTVALWFNTTSGGVLVNEMGQPDINTDWNTSLIEVMPNGQVKVRVQYLQEVSLGQVSPGTWHHAAMRYDETTQTLDGFLDGVQSATNIVGIRTAPWQEGNQLYYGFGALAAYDMGYGLYFGGQIDDVRVYNGALPAEQIMALANPHPIGDINGDHYVNIGDLQLLVAKWGQGPSFIGPEDINGDGYVNVGDLQVLVAHWGDHI